jgi:Phosphodiester glycosidase
VIVWGYVSGSARNYVSASREPGLLAIDGLAVQSERSERQHVSGSRYERHRIELRGGLGTTLHIVTYDRAEITPRVVVLEQAMPLVRWCEQQGVSDAVVGGFFIRALSEPLGEVWIDGRQEPSTPFDAPWGALRACVHVDGDGLRMARRDALPVAPAGHLLQAGPLLVADGRSAVAEGSDIEGFSIGARQFDSDITDGRFPRAALARTSQHLLAVACDGRTDSDAGMTLDELAQALVSLGSEEAINLDGGGSASLVHAGLLRNRPREDGGVDLLEGRAIVTAIVFDPRA